MKKIVLSIFITLMFSLAVSAQQTTSFSYQGKLNSSSTPANGNHDFKFELYSVVSGGTAIGTVNINNVSVTNGIFTVQLDFGANTFDGTDRFLDISVKQSAVGGFTTLTPRQKIASVPYATKAIKSENADSLGGITANNYLQKTGDGSQLTNLNGASITSGTVTSTQLSQEVVPNSSAYKLLGSLRWDLLKPQADFAVGVSPQGIAFDGANIWVANAASNNVTKLRASDGANLGTFTGGATPFAVAFDGANIWVANLGSDNVTKLRASDGANLGTFPVGNNPNRVAFDGANIWVTNALSNNVTKLRASDGANLGTFPVGNQPSGVAFDGANIWVANNGSNSVTRMQPAFPQP